MFLLCPLNPRHDLSGMKAMRDLWAQNDTDTQWHLFSCIALAVQCRDMEVWQCVLAGRGGPQCLLEGWLQTCCWSICGYVKVLFPGCAMVALQSSVQSDGNRHCNE